MFSDAKVFSVDAKIKNVYKFNEALTLTGFGKYNLYVTLLCGLISLGNILETMGFSFIISASQCDLNLTLTQKGWLAAIPFIGLVSSSQIWGYLADTRGRRKMLMMSMCLGAVCSMLSSLSPNLVVFAILRLLSAALMAASNAIVHAYFGELTPKSHMDTMISILSSVIIGSTIAATGIAWGVLTLNFNIPIEFLGFDYKPWRLLILCDATPFILASIALIKAPESPKYLMSQGRNDEVLKILQRMYIVNSSKDVSSYPVGALTLDDQDKAVNKNEKKNMFQIIWSQTVPIFEPPLLKYTLILFLIAFGVYGCGNGTFMWLPDITDRFFVAVDNGLTDGKTFCETLSVRTNLLLTEVANSTSNATVCDDSFKPGSYPTILALASIVTLSNVLVAVLLRWISKKIILLVSIGGGAISTVLMYFITNLYLYWFFYIIFLCLGVLVGIVSAFAVELFPTQYRAMAVSTILLFGRIGSIVGTNLIGLLIETNCDLNFFLFSGILFASCIAGFFLPDNRIKKKSLEVTKL